MTEVCDCVEPLRKAIGDAAHKAAQHKTEHSNSLSAAEADTARALRRYRAIIYAKRELEG